jgi:hypothetical protein
MRASIQAFFVFLAAIASLCALSSCEAEAKAPSLMKSPAFAEDRYYGVIADSYFPSRVEPSANAAFSFYLRRGDIVELVRKMTVKAEADERAELWYQIDFKGSRAWILASSLTSPTKPYTSLAQAERASRELGK